MSSSLLISKFKFMWGILWAKKYNFLQSPKSSLVYSMADFFLRGNWRTHTFWLRVVNPMECILKVSSK